MPSTTLPDLKGALCGGFCDARVAFISAVLSVDPQQRQGPENEEASASALNPGLTHQYHALFPSIRFPEGRKIANLVAASAPL